MNVTKGMICCITTGEYSDFSISILCKITKDFDTTEIINQYLTEFPEQKPYYNAKFNKFIKWLLDKRLIKEVKNQVIWHLGSDGVFDELEYE